MSAQLERRKAVQNLVQDVRLAWWRAEAAQRLIPQIETLLEEVDQAIERSKIIENRKLLPPLQTASIRRALLDLEQQISLKRQELAQARVEQLGHPGGAGAEHDPLAEAQRHRDGQRDDHRVARVEEGEQREREGDREQAGGDEQRPAAVAVRQPAEGRQGEELDHRRHKDPVQDDAARQPELAGHVGDREHGHDADVGRAYDERRKSYHYPCMLQ